MNQLRILLAEDDILHAARLEMLLEELEYLHVGTCKNFDETLELFHKTEPDLIILDIALNGRKDGIELAREINLTKATPIIFATSHEDKETIKLAIKENPYAYLIKPIEIGSLEAAIELAMSKSQTSANSMDYSWSDDLIVKDSLFIKTGGKLQKVQQQDVLWVEVAEDRYCAIVTRDKQFHLRTSLQQLESKLDPKIFIRIHRAYIININAIESIDETDNYVELNNRTIPIGNTFKNDLMKRLKLL